MPIQKTTLWEIKELVNKINRLIIKQMIKKKKE